MKPRLVSLVATPLFVFALAVVPAQAQRASLSDRVTALEARAGDNSATVDLLNQVSQLKSEVQALRAQVEEQQQLLQQMQSSGRSQYLDLDGRLQRLEGGGAPLTPAPAIAAPAGQGAATKPAAAGPTAASSGERQPTVYGDRGLVAQGADERAAYDAAFTVLRAGQYADAANRFQDFLSQYPNGAYAPNALYWLGESYYVTQNYPLAQQQFQALLERYPTHDKAAGAMLKLGLSQLGGKQVDAAERTLTDVVARYPGTDAARTASDRLGAIQLGRLR